MAFAVAYSQLRGKYRCKRAWGSLRRTSISSEAMPSGLNRRNMRRENCSMVGGILPAPPRVQEAALAHNRHDQHAIPTMAEHYDMPRSQGHGCNACCLQAALFPIACSVRMWAQPWLAGLVSAAWRAASASLAAQQRQSFHPGQGKGKLMWPRPAAGGSRPSLR